MRLRSYIAFPLHMLRRPGQARYILRWLASLLPEPLCSPVPWLTFAAIDRLHQLDLRGAQVFEYGSGASTLYWLQRGAALTSIEHDPAWYIRVRRRLPRYAPVDYRLVVPEPGPIADPADPQAYASAGMPAYSFKHYVEQIGAVPDGSLDIVLIDGRARPACLAHAAPKLRPGGLLILDNSDRRYYTARLGGLLDGWERTIYAGAAPYQPIFTETSLWVRHAA
jgi:hypothetical protein